MCCWDNEESREFFAAAKKKWNDNFPNLIVELKKAYVAPFPGEQTKAINTVKDWIVEDWLLQNHPERFKRGLEVGEFDQLAQIIARELISRAFAYSDSLLFHGNPVLKCESSVAENEKFWKTELGLGLIAEAKNGAEKIFDDSKILDDVLEEFRFKTSPLKYEAESIDKIKSGDKIIRTQIVVNMANQIVWEAKWRQQGSPDNTKHWLDTDLIKNWAGMPAKDPQVLIALITRATEYATDHMINWVKARQGKIQKLLRKNEAIDIEIERFKNLFKLKTFGDSLKDEDTALKVNGFLEQQLFRYLEWNYRTLNLICLISPKRH